MTKSTKTIFKYLFKISFTIVMFIIIIMGFQKKIGSQENIIETIKMNFASINIATSLLALTIFILLSIVANIRMYFLTKAHEIKISYITLLKNLYIGFLFNPILMGSTGGDIVRSYYLTKETADKTKVVTVLFLDRFIGIISMFTLGIIAMLFNYNDPKLASVLHPVLYSTACIYLVLIIIAIMASSKKVISRFSRFKNFIGIKKIKSIAKIIFDTLHQTKQHKKTIVLAVFCTVVTQILVVISAWIAAKSITNIEAIPFKYFLLFIPIILTISAIPISLGGIGVGEAAYAALFHFVGVSEANAITISLLNRSLLIFIAFIGGIIYLLPSTRKIDLNKC